MSPSPLAQALAKARRDARLLEGAPVPVGSVEAAYAVQDELVTLSGGGVRGWKVTALGDADQAEILVDPAGGRRAARAARP